jgi:hypothetical protein
VKKKQSTKLTLCTETVAHLSTKTALKAGYIVTPSQNSCAVGRPTHCNLP